MTDKPQKVLILGSSALKIGEAGEFDYSGSQAIKALKEEGITTILINPNIATIQTSDHLADEVYFLPVTPYFVEKLMEKLRPDGLLLSFGGQTALNCGVELYKSGVLERLGVRVLGTPVETILATEDRDVFVQKLNEVDVKSPRSQAASSVEEAVAFGDELGYPVMVRIAYALGGLGSGICRSREELTDRVHKALSYTNQVLVEESLHGWKEVEYEVVRDRHDNCITVCNMENFDPLGIHTGESIVVAPSQTLTNREYHQLREISSRTIRHLGVVGECNIQYALDPESEDYRVIEVNARLSRSSALASKATGYPLAFVAAKLALGYGLHELPNNVTKVTKALFEPALDYCVVKVPRWDMRKFRLVSRQLGSAMKSVGEVMSIGRSFEEAIQKALRMLAVGARGLVANDGFEFGSLEEELENPTEERIFAITKALQRGRTIDEVYDLTRIDKWFLHKIKNVVDIDEDLMKYEGAAIPRDLIKQAKRAGFADEQIAWLTKQEVQEIRKQRLEHNITPVIRQIDTLGAEYPAQTNYLYLSYHGDRDDLDMPAADSSVLVLGSGAYCIGSSVEFDWCCVNAVRTLRDMGLKTAMLNYNPETVSTDYDESDLLFFDEISLETVQDIVAKLQPKGVIVSMGGQIPNNIALKLHQAGVTILGTHPELIDTAEDRGKFSAALDELGIDQPEWRELKDVKEAHDFGAEVGYPVLVRPSYVLSGAAMAVACNDDELTQYLDRAADVSSDHPVVMSKFLDNAKELEFDAVAKDGEIIIYAISEHVENAGVHSGDATLVLPPQRTYLETLRRVRQTARAIAKRLNINGCFNIQLIAKNNDVKVIECNLRASRSFPFVSKVLKTNFIDLAVRAIMDEDVQPVEDSLFELDYVGVKAPQFSFTRLEGADPVLGVEMASTGEVACLGDDFNEAFLKALLSVGYELPINSVLLSTGDTESKADLLPACRAMAHLGWKLYATPGTHDFLEANGVETETLYWPMDDYEPVTTDHIKAGKVDLVVNIPKNFQSDELTMDYTIRRTAVDYKVPLITNKQILARLVEALEHVDLEKLQLKSWSDYKKIVEFSAN
jgi:carbamoyl-phosphate synthase large subunit